MQIVSERLFRVIDGSHTFKAIQAYLDARVFASDSWERFCDQYGAEQYYAGDSLIGLLFEHSSKVPAGWISAGRNHPSYVYRPNLRDKACKDAATQYRALPSMPSMFEWLDMLEIPMLIGARRAMKAPGFKKISGKYYLTASEGCAVPDDVEEVLSKDALRLNEIYEKEQEQQNA